MTFLKTTFDQSKSFAGQTPHLAKSEQEPQQPTSKFAAAMASLGETTEAEVKERVVVVEEKPQVVEKPPPYNYTYSDKINPPEDWQLDDLEDMYKSATTRGYCANWSEMGCLKTSTGLWLIQRLWREHWKQTLGEKHPNVWICTTRSGKGTFFKLAPEILEGWYIFNMTSQGMFVVQDGKQVKLKLHKVPEYFEMPTLVVSHFNYYSRSNKGQFLELEGIPITDEDGAIKMKPWTPADHFVERQWDMCWVDEAHRIKDKDTKWTVIIKRAKDGIRMDSTGTGFINRPDEIWSLGDHMVKSEVAKKNPDDPIKKEFMSWYDFRDEFCLIDDDEGYEKVIGVRPERKDEFRAIVRSLGPRRTLSEVMPHIKEPIFVPHDVELNPIQRKMYDQIKNELQTLDQNGVPIYSANVLSLLQRLRAICVATPQVVEEYYDEQTERMRQRIKLVEPSSKIDAAMDIMDGLEWDEERKDPVVIFSNFIGPLMLLRDRFNKANANAMEMGFNPEYPYIWMKEEHSDQERYNMWNDLFPSMEYRVFMSTLQLGGESITLTPARHLIFLDRSWSPKDNAQGIGRIRRPGQEGQPIVININAKNTVDSYIHAVNNMKQGWFNEIFSDEV